MDDLYADYATAAFGREVGEQAGVILAGLDSFPAHTGNSSTTCRPGRDGSQPRLPRAGLICCGRWRADTGSHNPHDQGSVPDPSAYAFADQFRALRANVTDPASLERFDQWAFQLQYHQRLAEVQRAAHALMSTVGQLENVSGAAARRTAAKTTGLGALSNFSRSYERMMTSLLRFASTPGELGMVAQHENMNWQGLMNHNYHGPGLLDRLRNLTGAAAIPTDALPSSDYLGQPRMFVLTLRTMVDPAVEDSLPVIVIVLAQRAALPDSVTLLHRSLGANVTNSLLSFCDGRCRFRNDRQAWLGWIQMY